MSQTSRVEYSSGDSSPREGFWYWGGRSLDGRLERRFREACMSHWPWLLRFRLKESRGTVSWAQGLKRLGVSEGKSGSASSSLPSLHSYRWVWETWIPSHCCRTLVRSAPTPPPPYPPPPPPPLYPPFLPFLAHPRSAIRRPLTIHEGQSPQSASFCLSFSLIHWVLCRATLMFLYKHWLTITGKRPGVLGKEAKS